jgi:hypothetical protein
VIRRTSIARVLTPRLRPIIVIAAAVALSACSLTTNPDTAASVGDATLSQSELDDIIGSDLGSSVLQIPADAQRISGDAVRGTISSWAVLAAVQETGLFEAPSPSPSEETLAQQNGAQWDSAPQVLRDLLTYNADLNSAIQAGTVDADALRAAIEQVPVEVNARYGRWDSTALAVVPLGR